MLECESAMATFAHCQLSDVKPIQVCRKMMLKVSAPANLDFAFRDVELC